MNPEKPPSVLGVKDAGGEDDEDPRVDGHPSTKGHIRNRCPCSPPDPCAAPTDHAPCGSLGRRGGHRTWQRQTTDYPQGVYQWVPAGCSTPSWGTRAGMPLRPVTAGRLTGGAV